MHGGQPAEQVIAHVWAQLHDRLVVGDDKAFGQDGGLTIFECMHLGGSGPACRRDLLDAHPEDPLADTPGVVGESAHCLNVVLFGALCHEM
ncbi:Uncharacterised protein [Mycobacteroides abscessus subsp. massiliense]|nr:Uncharacterised protein [Mycobacteroides abscessus subsp. massiliense]